MYRDLIDDALNGHGADYCEIRIEETDSTRLSYSGKKLDIVAETSDRGGNVRACLNGGWGFSSFNDLNNLKLKVKNVVAQAAAVGGDGLNFKQMEPFVDVVEPNLPCDASKISLKEKIQQMDHYSEILWSIDGVHSSDIIYGDNRKVVFFGNSEGTYVQQEFNHVINRISAQARDGSEVQQAGFSIGSLGDYNLVRDLDDKVLDCARRAVRLLSAQPLDGGERTVILDPVLAGVFVHEAFGHLSESDNIAGNQKLQDLMFMGRKFGGKHLNFTDGGLLPGLRGSFKYDDEGTPATITPLVREGELVGRLHSRETAVRLGECTTGNARSISYKFPPIVRMTNTIIEPGDATLEDLLEGVDQGVYVANWYGGMTQHEMFTFSSGEAYMIRNGRIEEPVKPVMLTGNLFSTLESLDAVGNDLAMNQGGGCGKGGQMPLPVSNGSPHIRIQDCLISGA